jgi:glutathione S-transferase
LSKAAGRLPRRNAAAGPFPRFAPERRKAAAEPFPLQEKAGRALPAARYDAAMPPTTYPDLVLYAPEPASVRVIECSPPSWLVLLALHEKRLPHALRQLSFARGEHRTPEMLAMNPRGTIPVLRDGDVPVHETFAILEYLEHAYPLIPLLPAGKARARALTRFHESEALKARGMQLFAQLMRAPESEHRSQPIRDMIRALDDELAHWERYYGEAAWAAGSEISLADLVVFVYVATASHLGLPLAERYPSLAAFHDRMRARESVRATWPATWNDIPHTILAGAR